MAALRVANCAAKNELLEAQIWAAKYADPARPKECLRNEQLRPQILHSGVLDAVDHVRRRRHWTLPGSAIAAAVTPILSGRVMVYFPDVNLCDGMAELETSGYFDVDNTPPWDTWVALLVEADTNASSRASVIAWVPSAFVPLVECGIEVNPEGCIAWLDDCPLSLQAAWALAVATENEGLRFYP